MAGFAINLNLIHNYPDARFSNFVQRGYQESTLLSGMQIVLEDLEPKAKMCTEVNKLKVHKLFFLIKKNTYNKVLIF